MELKLGWTSLISLQSMWLMVAALNLTPVFVWTNSASCGLAVLVRAISLFTAATGQRGCGVEPLLRHGIIMSGGLLNVLWFLNRKPSCSGITILSCSKTTFFLFKAASSDTRFPTARATKKRVPVKLSSGDALSPENFGDSSRSSTSSSDHVGRILLVGGFLFLYQLLWVLLSRLSCWCLARPAFFAIPS